MSDIDEPIIGMRQCAVINPHIGRSHNRYGVAIGPQPVSDMGLRIPNPAGFPTGAVVDVQPMDYDVGDFLNSYAWPVRNLNISPPPVNSLEALHHELILELDHHVSLENDPQRFGLDDAVTERSRLWAGRIVRWVGYHVDCTVRASKCGLAETHRAVGQCLAG